LETKEVEVRNKKKLQFVHRLAVCACHLGLNDIVGQLRNGQKTWVLSPSARIQSSFELSLIAFSWFSEETTQQMSWEHTPCQMKKGRRRENGRALAGNQQQTQRCSLSVSVQRCVNEVTFRKK